MRKLRDFVNFLTILSPFFLISGAVSNYFKEIYEYGSGHWFAAVLICIGSGAVCFCFPALVRVCDNEFDLLLVHENRMLVVECMIANLYSGPESGQEVVNRLESLDRNAGGLFGSTLLLSARGLPNEIRNRCASQGVGVRQGEELRKLKQDLETWKETGEIGPVA